MRSMLHAAAAASALLAVMSAAGTALAQKQGGILRMYTPDSPASMSIHEEATVFAIGPMMGGFNNLVMFDQHVKQNSLESIIPDLATGWSWNEGGDHCDIPAAARRQMARRPGLHGAGCQMHLGFVNGEAPRQSPQILVRQSRRAHNQRRLRSRLSSEAPTAGIF